MAENKKSFVAYCDWLEVFENLEDDEAGRLAKHLFKYVNDLDPTSDRLTEMLFIQIKQSLKRDLVKYEQYIEKQRVNGAKGGRPKKTQKTQPFFEKPKKADSVSDSDSVSVSDSENDIKNYIIKAKNDFQWCEVIQMQNPKKFNKQITLESRLNEFETWLRIEGKTHNNYSKFIQHFTNWINKKPEVAQAKPIFSKKDL